MQWNEFKNIIYSAFEELRNDPELTDVTLVCKGGEQLKAHKIVLASASPFFMDLFKRNSHPHPLLYLRGLGVEDLAAMVEFLYTGQANILIEIFVNIFIIHNYYSPGRQTSLSKYL